MRVDRFSVRRFRNLAELDFHPAPGVNVIAGDNAQGKTNLLEALWLFTGARSFRGSKDREFLNPQSDTVELDLAFQSGGREQTATLRYGEDKRAVELNGVKQPRPSAFGSVFCAVVFSPDDLSVVKHGPELRRRLIDTSLFQAYPKYTKAIENYQKALRQRNALLKDIRFHAGLDALLEVWDRHISEYGGYISKLRAGYVRRLAEEAALIYQGISSDREQLELRYLPGYRHPAADSTVPGYQEAVLRSLEDARADDIRLGVTGDGPHRDDLEILVDGKSARTFGSQGQQRSCILALKLAECAILEERSGEPPVVMLDDVMSELDRGRRDYLLHQLKNRQIFITCCDQDAFSSLDELAGGRLFWMERGCLTPQ